MSDFSGDGDDGYSSYPFQMTPIEPDPSMQENPVGNQQLPLILDPRLIGGGSGLTETELNTGGGDDWLKALLKGLGFIKPGGSIDALSLMGLLGPALGGILNNRSLNRATEANQKANDDAIKWMKDKDVSNAALFKPYIDAGGPALANLQAQGPFNTATKFAPLGSGYGMGLSANNQMPRGSTFADIFAQRGKGG